MDELNIEPLDINGGFKKIMRNVAKNASWVIGTLAVFVIIVVSFTDISFTGSFTARFSTSLVLLLICNYVEYFSMKHLGKEEARNEKKYRDAQDKYEDTVEDVRAKGFISRIPDFCYYYTKEDYEKRLRRILLQANIEYNTYVKHYRGKKKKELPAELTDFEKKVIILANDVKPLNLSIEYIVSVSGERATTRTPKDPAKISLQQDIQYLIPTLLSTFFVVGILVEAIGNPTFATFATCIVKVFLLVWNGIKGYQNGYYNILRDSIDYTIARTNLLLEAKVWCESHETENVSEPASAPVNAESIFREESNLQKM